MNYISRSKTLEQHCFGSKPLKTHSLHMNVWFALDGQSEECVCLWERGGSRKHFSNISFREALRSQDASLHLRDLWAEMHVGSWKMHAPLKYTFILSPKFTVPTKNQNKTGRPEKRSWKYLSLACLNSSIVHCRGEKNKTAIKVTP